MLIAGIGTRLSVSGHMAEIIEIHRYAVLASIVEGPQIGRVVTLTFEQVERAAGL